MTEIPQGDALLLLLSATAGSELPTSYREIRSRRPDGAGGMDQAFFPVRDVYPAARKILELGEFTDVYLSAAPRVHKSGRADAVERVHCLYVDCDTPQSVERLRAFRPLPSIVIRSGSGGVHGWWPLSSPLPPAWAVVANRRLAFKLASDRKATDAARVMRAPGTWNFKHDPARFVECIRLEFDKFTAAEVVGGLPDEPRLVQTPAPRSGNFSERAPKRLEALARFVEVAQPGERNASLFWAACRVAEDDLDGLEQLRAAALTAGLDEREIEATLQSATRTAAA